MKYFRAGKAGAKERRAKAREREREDLIHRAVTAARYAIDQPGLCLQTSYLLCRIFAEVAPTFRHTLRLGSLHVASRSAPERALTFDPRGPDGIDGGFHAWVEDPSGELLDPTIFLTLADRGFDVHPGDDIIAAARVVQFADLDLVYEELSELELLGAVESETQVQHLLAQALRGVPAPPGLVRLDVGWRAMAR